MKTSLLLIIVLAASFFGGWKAHQEFRPCPVIESDTVYVYDTTIRVIRDTVPWYIIRKDTVIVNHNIPAIVDTSAILADYYNFHYYSRDWYDITSDNDTIIHINLEDVISQNMPLDNNFSYRWFKPQTIINNTVINNNYSRYLYAGLSMPLNDYKFTAGSVYFASDRLLLGVGYIPYYKSFNITTGFKLIQFRQR